MQFKGWRKFVVIILSLIVFFWLSYMAIAENVDGLVGVIGAIGGGIGVVLTPFMASNYGENKVEKVDGSKS